jgi:hypothetical protein
MFMIHKQYVLSFEGHSPPPRFLLVLYEVEDYVIYSYTSASRYTLTCPRCFSGV